MCFEVSRPLSYHADVGAVGEVEHLAERHRHALGVVQARVPGGSSVAAAAAAARQATLARANEVHVVALESRSGDE